MGIYSFVMEDVEGKINISIDTWTSSDNYAFMAIITHYVTKAGQLGRFNQRGNNISALLTKLISVEELLINFHGLEGEHSGANMAEQSGKH